MCLGIPGKVVEISDGPLKMARVDFGGVRKEACLEYVPETQIGAVQLGQAIAVQVDSFPGRTFEGRVTFIASQAEFTPRNVQIKSERVNMVFAVKLEIPNASLDLKPGMPADAIIE